MQKMVRLEALVIVIAFASCSDGYRRGSVMMVTVVASQFQFNCVSYSLGMPWLFDGYVSIPYPPRDDGQCEKNTSSTNITLTIVGRRRVGHGGGGGGGGRGRRRGVGGGGVTTLSRT
jgi:hypothetical protein